jgi:hypothetical protein
MMAGEEADQDSTLTKVARTVGSALGTVASKVTDAVGAKPEEPSDDQVKPSKESPKEPKAATKAPAKKSAPRKAATDQKDKALAQKKAKRAKHKRKLGRKTRG